MQTDILKTKEYAGLLAKYQSLRERYEIGELEELFASFLKMLAVDNVEVPDFYTSDLVPSLHQLAAAGKVGSDELLEELHNQLMIYYPQFMGHLQQFSGMLNLQNMNICMLSRLHFHPSEIATLLDLTPQTITNRRARMLAHIFHKSVSTSRFEDVMLRL